MLSAFWTAVPSQASTRETILLNGTWQVEDSIRGDRAPDSYTHTAPVPGLTHSATPSFKDVDAFESRELIHSLIDLKLAPETYGDRLKPEDKGYSKQERNYFWYRRTFQAPAPRAVAMLKVNKAQFGIGVYLNGERVGEHFPCFTAAYLDVTRAVRWSGDNELVIRVGAHPNVLPPSVSQGTDFEKNVWTPGIYDDVSISFFDNPGIANIQVAPQIAKSEILIQTELRNAGGACSTPLTHSIIEARSGVKVAELSAGEVTLAAGETKAVQHRIVIPDAKLWSPESPFLYRVVTTTRGDSVSTRFGMREFRFDTATQRAYLNGKPYFLRGSNITLHRFFEDPDSGTLPWDEAWVRRLLVDIPRQFNWNAFRFCIGPVPDRWLEIADEAGLLIQNEYFIWVGHPSWGRKWDVRYDYKELVGEFTEWMRDNWNHPSVIVWDANNESWLPGFADEVIAKVRHLDLSNRAWENSYNPPAGPDDPVEDHPYLWQPTATSGKREFDMTRLEGMIGLNSHSQAKTAHALILNEYGWLWLNRDGSPTLLTDKLYPLLLGESATSEQRTALQCYLLGGETEFWRAYRRYAAVLHFVYLMASTPNGFTADHFTDVKSLTLHPEFVKHMREAFKPLGVYLNYWQPTAKPGSEHTFTVMMVNDTAHQRRGSLRLGAFDAGGHEVVATESPFVLAPTGAETYLLTLRLPAEPGAYELRAIATADDLISDPTVSRRRVTVQN